MADGTPHDLSAFAAAHPELDQRPRCLLCNIAPELERQAREGKEAGITYKVIGAWLETVIGEPVTKGRMERHFQEGHTR